MQTTSARAVRHAEGGAVVPQEGQIFRGSEMNSIMSLLRVGSRLEIKFPGDCDPEHLGYLMDLRARSAIELDPPSVRFVTAVYTSIDRNRRPTWPISFVLTEEFFKWEGRRTRFFQGLCPRLEYIKLLPA